MRSPQRVCSLVEGVVRVRQCPLVTAPARAWETLCAGQRGWGRAGGSAQAPDAHGIFPDVFELSLGVCGPQGEVVVWGRGRSEASKSQAQRTASVKFKGQHTRASSGRLLN